MVWTGLWTGVIGHQKVVSNAMLRSEKNIAPRGSSTGVTRYSSRLSRISHQRTRSQRGPRACRTSANVVPLRGHAAVREAMRVHRSELRSEPGSSVNDRGLLTFPFHYIRHRAALDFVSALLQPVLSVCRRRQRPDRHRVSLACSTQQKRLGPSCQSRTWASSLVRSISKLT